MSERSRPNFGLSHVHRWLDAGRAPLYVLTYPRERDLGDMMAAHDAVEAIYKRTEGPIGWVVDASHVVGASPKERQVVVNHQRRVAAFEEQRCVGVGLVIPNAIVRGLYTAIRWIEPAHSAYEAFAGRDEAQRWVEARLAASRA